MSREPKHFFGQSLKSLYRDHPALMQLAEADENTIRWLEMLSRNLDAHRFFHSLAVVDCASRLARIHGLNMKKASQAALLHDCAKCMRLEDMRVLAEKHRITDDADMLSSGALLHSLVGAWVAEHVYGMTDPDVLEAIAFHNTGHSGMSRLAMCVCLADSIEPTRKPYSGLDEIRSLAEINLERALLMSLEKTAGFVIDRGKFLHSRTLETIAWLRTLPACSVGMTT